MYLPKMVPLKWGCRGVWDVLGIRGVWGGIWYNRSEKGRHPHMGQYLSIKLCMPPTIAVGGCLAHVGEDVKRPGSKKTHQHSTSCSPALLPPLHGPNNLLQQLWGHVQLHW